MVKRRDTSKAASTKSERKEFKPPETALQFVIYMVRGMVFNIPKRILFMIVTSLLVLGLHTYLMVYINDGFWRNEGSAVLQYILMYKDQATSLTQKLQLMTPAVFWYTVSIIFWGSIGQIRTVGFFTFLKKLGLWFVQLVGTLLKKANRTHSITLTFWVFCSFAVSIIFANPIVTMVVAVALYLAGCARDTGALYTFFKLARSDWARFRKKTDDPTLSDGFSLALLYGSAIGTLIYFAIRVSSNVAFIPYLVLVLLLITHVLNTVGASKKTTAAVFFAGIFAVSRIHFSFADDGGWSEAGGTLWDWFGSEGSLTAFAQSSIASGMSILGVLAIDAGNLVRGLWRRVGRAADTFVDVTNRAFTSLDNAFGMGTSLVATWYADRNVAADRTVDQIRAANNRSSLWARTQKQGNFTKYGTRVPKIDMLGKVGGFIIPVAVDTYGNYVKGASRTEFIADAVVDVGVTASSIYVGGQLGVTFGSVAGPPGMLVGAVVGVGTSLVFAYVTDGFVIGTDQSGGEITIKSWMQDKFRSDLDTSARLFD